MLTAWHDDDDDDDDDSLLLLPGSIRPKMVLLVRVPSIGQIELFNHLTVCKQMTDGKLNC